MRTEIKHIKDRCNLQEFSKSGWESDEGSTSVEDDTSVIKFRSVFAKGDGVELNLPVGLATKRDSSHLASVVVLADTTESSNRVIAILIGVTKVEGKNGLIQQALVKHVVEWGDDLVDRDGVIAET